MSWVCNCYREEEGGARTYVHQPLDVLRCPLCKARRPGHDDERGDLSVLPVPDAIVKAISDARFAGQVEERRQIIAWLRSGDCIGGDDAVARTIAEQIEAGAHVLAHNPRG